MNDTAPPTTAPARTPDALADAVIATLDPAYELVYVDYRDELTDTQIAAIVRNDWEAFWDSTADFESDQRIEQARHIITEQVQTVLSDWEDEDGENYDELADDFEWSEPWERVREAVEERDTGDWPRQLARQSNNVLLRIPVAALDEDHAFSFEPVSAAQVLGRLGAPLTEGNLTTLADTLAECSPEFSVLMGYWIVGADVEDLYQLGSDTTEVEIVNPYLYLGNPFSGSGWIGYTALKFTVRIPRDELRTDKDAFGYSVDEVFGGLNPSSFAATIRPVPATTETTPAA